MGDVVGEDAQLGTRVRASDARIQKSTTLRHQELPHVQSEDKGREKQVHVPVPLYSPVTCVACENVVP